MSKEIRKYNYIIGSGWWCGDNPENEKRIIVGDDSIRGKDFHKLWYDCDEDHARNPSSNEASGLILVGLHTACFHKSVLEVYFDDGRPVA